MEGSGELAALVLSTLINRRLRGRMELESGSFVEETRVDEAM